MAYIDIVNKYKKNQLTEQDEEGVGPLEQQSREVAPQLKVREIDKLKDNPYKGLVENYKHTKRVQQFIAGGRQADKDIEKTLNPGIIKSVTDVAKGIPGAFVDMTKFVVTKPDKAARAGVTGLLDFGPTAVNTLHWLGRSIQSVIAKPFGLEGAVAPEMRLPKPSETLAEYLGYERSDEELALSESTTMVTGYGAGQAAFKTLGFGKAVTNIGGDILGGQLITESTDPKERATQAVFDGLFGVLQYGAGRAYRAIKGAPKAAPTVARHLQSADDILRETPDAVKADMAGFLAQQKKNIVDGLTAQGEKSFAKLVDDIDTSSISSLDDFKKAVAETGLDIAEKADGGGKILNELDDAVAKADDSIVEKPTQMRETGEGSRTAYVPKDDLGVDTRGKKVMATTEVDTKTGDAVVYYVKELDANPELRQIVWDFEEPHILDKRLSRVGDSFTPALRNPGGNISILENALGTFAQKMGQSVDEIAVILREDIQKIANNNKVITEQFADAYGLFKNNPDAIRKKAPVFAKFMDHELLPPRFAKNITTEADLGGNFPRLKEVSEAPVDPIGRRLQAVSSREKQLTDNMADREMAGKRAKGDALSLAAIERKVRGRPTATELQTAKTYLDSNYRGKKVTVDGKPVTLTGRVSFGKYEVILKNGTNKYVAGTAIKAPKATKADALEHLRKTATDELKGREALYGLKAPRGRAASAPAAPKTEAKAPAKKAEPKAEAAPAPEAKPGKFAETGLDTKKRVEDKPSFNIKSIDAPEKVEELFVKMDAENKSFSKERISKSNEDLKDLARMVGLTADDLAEVNPGSIANAETLVAARQLVLNKTADLANKLKGVDVDKASLAEKAEVRDAFLQLISMQKSVAGLRTEASNVLRSFGVKLRPGENIAIDELITNLKKLGIDDIDPNDVNALSRASGKVIESLELTRGQKIGRGYLQTWYAAILSGPKTTVRNVLSTAANILSDLTSKSLNPRMWKELKPSIDGLVRGFKESAEPGELKRIFTLQSMDPSTGKFYDAPTPDADKIFTGKWETFGKIVEIPGRLLNRQDARFSASARGMEEAALKVYNPEMTDAVMKAVSESYGVASVYRGMPKGRIIRGITQGALTTLRTVPEARIIMPFVRTVANVVDRQFDYMPIFSTLRLGKIKIPTGKGKFIEVGSDILEVQADQIARDFGITDKLQKDMIVTRLRDQQIGRMNLGLAMTGIAVVMAKEGMVSGSGPSNYSERIQLQRTGWRPNSIKIGNTWIPYTYLGPIGGIFALGGNIHDKVVYDNKPNSEVYELVGHGIKGWMSTQLDSSFLSGLRDLIDALSSTGNGEKYLANLAANVTPIPQAWTQTLEMTKNVIGSVTGDDSLKYQYETRNIIDKLRVKLGLTGDIGIADALNPRIDMFGEPMKGDLIWGITPSEDRREAMAVDDFLISNDIVVSMPVYTREYVTPTGEKRALSEDEFNKYVKTSGREIYRTLKEMAPSLEGLPPEEIKASVKDIVSDIRKQVRDELLLNNE